MGKRIIKEIVIYFIIAFVACFIISALTRIGIPTNKMGDYFIWGFFLISLGLPYDIIRNFMRKKSFGDILYHASPDTLKFQWLVTALLGICTISSLILVITSFTLVTAASFWFTANIVFMNLSHPSSQTGITAQGIAYRGTYTPWQNITTYRWHDSILEVDIASQFLGLKNKATLKLTCNPDLVPAMGDYLREKLG